MGWWTSDGGGVIGDRPVDIVDQVLTDALGDRFGAELFQGFLGAVGAALARNPGELLADGLDPERTVFVVEYDGPAPAHVPVLPPVIQTALDDAVYAALSDIAFEYRVSTLDRSPFLAEVLDTIAFAARSHLDVGLVGIRPVVAAEGDHISVRSWAAMRALLADGPPLPPGAVELVAETLGDPDWRARMTAALVVGRFRIGALARRAAAVDVPPAGGGLREDDRRALLALRDVAAARAEGRALERPVHPDPEVAAPRAELLADVEAAVAGDALPGRGSRAYVLRALAEQDAVAADPAAPSEWRAWLGAPDPLGL